MGKGVIILLILCLALLTAVIILAVKYRGQKKSISLLSGSIRKFLETGKQTDLSLKDNFFSAIQNDVADLESRLILEKGNTLAENRKNADFIADVSHQLKTPLAGLRLYCEMDNSSNPTERSEKELQLVSRMEKLVYNLLRLEKIRSDSYEMKFGPVQAETLANEIIGELRPVFPDRNYSVSGAASIRCDREWMREALGNIIKNAAEHTPAGGRVEVTVSESEKSTEITVEDNGGGLPEGQLLHIFERFYRSANASPDSVGIGLAVSRTVVGKHHGTVSAENGREGLRVIICLPKLDGIEKEI